MHVDDFGIYVSSVRVLRVFVVAFGVFTFFARSCVFVHVFGRVSKRSDKNNDNVCMCMYVCVYYLFVFVWYVCGCLCVFVYVRVCFFEECMYSLSRMPPCLLHVGFSVIVSTCVESRLPNAMGSTEGESPTCHCRLFEVIFQCGLV
jgi:predicted MFS family arabinose efflux permease